MWFLNLTHLIFCFAWIVLFLFFYFYFLLALFLFFVLFVCFPIHIVDVWFDSGTSWAGVVQSREELTYPADVYLEGSDQHRGWFQSSLLTSVANTGKAPFKTVLTHGFVLDEKGFKMSKSLGNVMDPLKVIEGGNNKKKEPAYGADVLRLWVANSDYSSDVLIGDKIIRQTFDSYRKLRNTARYLIGNLADFVPEQLDDDDDNDDNSDGGNDGTTTTTTTSTTAIPYEDLPSLDKYMLGLLSQSLNTIQEAMEQYQFQRAIQELLRFSTVDLSNFYLEVAKDRLYISGMDDFRRRSCQTVIHSCLEGFAKAVAPILPHMAEDIWQNLPYKDTKTTPESVFEGGVPSKLTSFVLHDDDQELWSFVRDLRYDVNKCLEAARADKLIGASMEAAAYVYVPDEESAKRAFLERLDGDVGLISPPIKTNGVDELRTVLMMSQINLVDRPEDVIEHCLEAHQVLATNALSGIMVGVTKAKGHKCERCWFYDKEIGSSSDRKHGDDLCQRCDEAITTWEEKNGKQFVHPTTVVAAATTKEEEEEEEQDATTAATSTAPIV